MSSSSMTTRSRDSDLVLSYYNCILRQSDLVLLTGPSWLNDTLIGFYFEHLDVLHGSDLLFVSPELTQLLKLTKPHEYPIFLNAIGARHRDFVFFPVNDCNSRSASGGSHWSLVVFSRRERACFYFDSSNGINASVAWKFSRGVMTYLLDSAEGHFVEVKCAQQKNGYDCGLFVLCFADVIAEHVLKAQRVDGCNCDGVESLVSNKRKSLLALIDKLKESKS